MFYDNFIALCKEKGVAPSAVAEEVGLNKSTVSYWKNGSQPKVDTIFKIADYFGVPAYRLMWADEEPIKFTIPIQELQESIGRPLEAAVAVMANDRAEKILSAFDQLNDAGQAKAVERVEELTEIPKYQKSPPPDETKDG